MIWLCSILIWSNRLWNIQVQNRSGFLGHPVNQEPKCYCKKMKKLEGRRGEGRDRVTE